MLNPAIRIALITAGWLCIALGVIGIVLPVLPTVPFILLAAACFARASPRFHQWLIQHPYFGPMVLQYQAGKGIPRHIRQRAVIMMWSGMLFTAWALGRLPLTLILATTGCCVSIFLYRMPSYEMEKTHADESISS